MPVQSIYISEISSRQIVLFVWYTHFKREQNYQLPAPEVWSLLIYLFNADRNQLNINIITTHSKTNWYSGSLFSWMFIIITQKFERHYFPCVFPSTFSELHFLGLILMTTTTTTTTMMMMMSIQVSRRFVGDV